MIINVDETQLKSLTKLALQLWPENNFDTLAAEFQLLLRDKNAACFLFIKDEALGFAQCQLRHDYVEGTDSSPVGYLEGIFVAEAARGQGIAGKLLQACQSWAKEKGCREFASDCTLDNQLSQRFHLRHGFIEANRIICFTKKL